MSYKDRSSTTPIKLNKQTEYLHQTLDNMYSPFARQIFYGYRLNKICSGFEVPASITNNWRYMLRNRYTLFLSLVELHTFFSMYNLINIIFDYAFANYLYKREYDKENIKYGYETNEKYLIPSKQLGYEWLLPHIKQLMDEHITPWTAHIPTCFADSITLYGDDAFFMFAVTPEYQKTTLLTVVQINKEVYGKFMNGDSCTSPFLEYDVVV